MDFSTKYRGVKHFGLWAEEGADELGTRDAINILIKAAQNSYNEDVRGGRVKEAIEFLRQFAVRKRPFDDYLKGLDIEEPTKRVMALYDALHRMMKEL